MIKVVHYVILVLAAALFALTVLLSPYQEVQFKFFPGLEPTPLSLSTLAFVYCGYGLLIAIILGLLDRMTLVMKVKKLEKENVKLLQHAGQLKSILAEDLPQPEVGATDKDLDSTDKV